MSGRLEIPLDFFFKIPLCFSNTLADASGEFIQTSLGSLQRVPCLQALLGVGHYKPGGQIPRQTQQGSHHASPSPSASSSYCSRESQMAASHCTRVLPGGNVLAAKVLPILRSCAML